MSIGTEDRPLILTAANAHVWSASCVESIWPESWHL